MATDKYYAALSSDMSVLREIKITAIMIRSIEGSRALFSRHIPLSHCHQDNCRNNNDDIQFFFTR